MKHLLKIALTALAVLFSTHQAPAASVLGKDPNDRLLPGLFTNQWTNADVIVDAINKHATIPLTGVVGGSGVTNAVATNAVVPSVSGGTIAVPTNYEAAGAAATALANAEAYADNKTANMVTNGQPVAQLGSVRSTDSNLSVDVNNRKLFDSTGGSGATSVNWGARIAYDASASPALDWGARTFLGNWNGVNVTNLQGANITGTVPSAGSATTAFSALTNAADSLPILTQAQQAANIAAATNGLPNGAFTVNPLTSIPVTSTNGFVLMNDVRVVTLTNAANTFAGTFKGGAYNATTNGNDNLPLLTQAQQAANIAAGKVATATNDASGAPITLAVTNTVYVAGNTNFTYTSNRMAYVFFNTNASSSSGGVTNGASVYLGQLGVTLEQFGGRGDAKVDYFINMTNGGTTVFSTSNSFTADDVGKVMVVYTDHADTNYLLTTVTGFINSSNLTVAAAAPSTATGVEARWGFDNTVAFKNATDTCLLNGIPDLYLTNGTYMVAGGLSSQFSYGGLAIQSIITIGNPSLHNYDFNGYSPWLTLRIKGAVPAEEATSGYFAGSRKSGFGGGSVIYCPTKGTNAVGDFLFSMSGTNNNFATLNMIFEDIKFYMPNRQTVGYIDNSYGGGLLVKQCQFDWDYYTQNDAFNSGGYQGQALGKTNLFAIRFALNSNNGIQFLEHCELNSGYNGVYTSDHAFISDTRLIRFANALVIGNGTPTALHNVEFDVNTTNILAGIDHTVSSISGDCSFYNDDTLPNHGGINVVNGQLLSGTLNVNWSLSTRPFYTNGVLSSGCPASLNLNIMNDSMNLTYGAYSKPSSNTWGNVINNAHFPYGVMAADAQGNFQDPWIWGGGENFSGFGVNNARGFYHSSQFHQESLMLMGDILTIDGGTLGSPVVDYIFDGAGSLSMVGTNLASMVVATNGIVCLASNTLPPTAISFPATTVNWTNKVGKSIEVMIDNTGVTGTGLFKNGGEIYGTALPLDANVHLQRGEYFSETYSVGTPTATFSPE